MENEVSKNTSDWIAVLMAALTLINVIATIIYVGFTIRIASFSKKATEISQEATKISQNAVEISQKQLEKVAELERNRTRPYVIFNIVSNEKHLTFASIKNYGLTAAYDIRISIEPVLNRAFMAHDDPCVITSNVFTILPPNSEIADSLGGSPDFYQKYQEPDFSGTIFYRDIGGGIYEEKFQIDLKSTSRRLWTGEKEIWRYLEDISKQLEKINKSLLKTEESLN